MFFLQCNPVRYKKANRKKSDIKYIVVHYTGNNGDTAQNNLKNASRAGRQASAHYFVDEHEVCQSVKVKDIAYHCGTKGKYRHAYCRNANSIGVEMCSRKTLNGDYYFKPETVNNAARFIAQLMREYDIGIAYVVRHYDVTGKICPRPYIEGAKWTEFKNLIMKYYIEEVEEMTYYETIAEIPFSAGREAVQKAVDRGVIAGTGAGLHLSEDMVRMFVFLDRLNVL